MVFTFGPTGSFGYCCAAPVARRVLGWWSNWGVPDVPTTNYVDQEDVRRQLRERHGTWADPIIRTIIEKMTTSRIYPIWTTPDLPHWGESGAVLLGDAAHTLQATSGQGAAQALEDSVTFSLLLSHYVEKSSAIGSEMATTSAIELAAKGLYEIRHPRVASIKAQARSIYLAKEQINNILFEYIYYCFIYLWTNFPIVGELVFLYQLPAGSTPLLFLTQNRQINTGRLVQRNSRMGCRRTSKGVLREKGSLKMLVKRRRNYLLLLKFLSLFALTYSFK